MTKPSELDALIARVEAAEGPDRELDAEIALVSGQWRCTENGTMWRPIPDDGPKRGWSGYFPAYTGSLDAAASLVPEGWFWRCGKTTLYSGWAFVHRTHPDHCDRCDEHSAKKEWRMGEWTPALALTAAALRARRSQL